MSRITLKFVSVTPQTLLTTENLCFKQKSNFFEKVLPPSSAWRVECLANPTKEIKYIFNISFVSGDWSYRSV